MKEVKEYGVQQGHLIAMGVCEDFKTSVILLSAKSICYFLYHFDALLFLGFRSTDKKIYNIGYFGITTRIFESQCVYYFIW